MPYIFKLKTMSDSGCGVSTLVCTYDQNLIVAEEYKNNEHQNCEKTGINVF